MQSETVEQLWQHGGETREGYVGRGMSEPTHAIVVGDEKEWAEIKIGIVNDIKNETDPDEIEQLADTLIAAMKARRDSMGRSLIYY